MFLPNMELSGACPPEGPTPGRLSLGISLRKTAFYPRSQGSHAHWSLTLTLCFELWWLLFVVLWASSSGPRLLRT